MSRLLEVHANERREVEAIWAGDIAAAVGLRGTTTGDTVCAEDAPVVLETIAFPAPVVTVAVEARTAAEQERLSASVAKLAAEDPTLVVGLDQETGRTLLSGMGELHLEIAVDRLLREFRVEAAVGRPSVAYRESVSLSAEATGQFGHDVEGRSGFGRVTLRVEPAQTWEFEDAAEPGSLSVACVSAAERGAREAADRGIIAGHPVSGVRVTLLGGVHREGEGAEAAFKVAAAEAFREAVRRAGPELLEPVMALEVVTPEEFLGEVLGDLKARGGKILAMEPRTGARLVRAEAALARLFGYATDLRSRSQGRATFTMLFSHYRPVSTRAGEGAPARVQ